VSDKCPSVLYLLDLAREAGEKIREYFYCKTPTIKAGVLFL